MSFSSSELPIVTWPLDMAFIFVWEQRWLASKDELLLRSSASACPICVLYLDRRLLTFLPCCSEVMNGSRWSAKTAGTCWLDQQPLFRSCFAVACEATAKAS